MQEYGVFKMIWERLCINKLGKLDIAVRLFGLFLDGEKTALDFFQDLRIDIRGDDLPDSADPRQILLHTIKQSFIFRIMPASTAIRFMAFLPVESWIPDRHHRL